MRRILIAMSFMLAFSVTAAEAAPCFIFVHGKQTDTGTFTNWSNARNYWKDGSRDFIGTATKGFSAPYYVVGYNGTRAYWNSQAAGEVANEIANAVAGGADGGGNTCAGATSYWVVAHSMGNTVMDFILGNASPSDPNYNFNGPYNTVAANVSLVVSVSGAHRGSEGADAVCGSGFFLCNFIAFFIQDCDEATSWLRSTDSVQVRGFSNAPARAVYLTGGYEAIFGASACLSGEDDGVVQHASQYACSGSATASYNNDNVCGNNSKQEASNFFNLDTAHEDHDDIRNDTDRDTRRMVPDGIWTCNGSPCSPGSQVQSSMSTAQFVAILW